jgi:hypothetical protein
MFNELPWSEFLIVNRKPPDYKRGLRSFLIVSPDNDLPHDEKAKSSKRPFFVARKRLKIAKILFDATPCDATTSDPIRAKNKNITGLGPRDLIALDSSLMLAEGRLKARNSASFQGNTDRR